MPSPQIIEHKAVRLHTTEDFLDLVLKLYDLKTDWQLHRKLGVEPQTIYRYRKAKSSFDDEVAIRVANLIAAKAPELKITPGYLLLCMAEERSRTAGAKAWWKDLRERALVVAVVSIGASAGAPPSVQAEQLHNNPIVNATGIHIVNFRYPGLATSVPSV